MYKKYFNTIGLAIIIPIIFLYAFQQGVSLAYNYWLSMWADDPIVNGTQIDTDLKLTVFGALGFVQGRFSIELIQKSSSDVWKTGYLGKNKSILLLFRRQHLWNHRRHLHLRHHRLSPPAHGSPDERAALAHVVL